MAGHRGEGRQQGDRLEFHHFSHAAARVVGAEHADGGAVGQEQQVKFPPFGGAGDVDRLGDVDAGTGVGAGMAPGGDMLAGFVHERAELHGSRKDGSGHAVTRSGTEKDRSGLGMDIGAMHLGLGSKRHAMAACCGTPSERPFRERCSPRSEQAR